MSLARYEHLLADAREAAVPDDLDEGLCPVCHGVMDGYIGYPGEWPCECQPEYDPDMDVDVARLLKAEEGDEQ